MLQQNNNKLIGLFVSENELEQNIELIKYKYAVNFGRIFVFNTDGEDLLITFNTMLSERTNLIEKSIFLHRNKLTNTLYTLNALNHVIKLQNGNFLDPTYKVDWEKYRNCLLTGRLNQISVTKTALHSIIQL